MEALQAFKDIAPYLTHPPVLIGFVLLLFFGIPRTLIEARINSVSLSEWDLS